MDGTDSTAVIVDTTDHSPECYGSKLESPPPNMDLEALGISGNNFLDPQSCSNTPQTPSTSIDFPVFHSKSESPQPGSCKTNLNPIAKSFRDLELGKAFLTYIMPIATILLAVHKKDSSPKLMDAILCLLCTALVALLYGNLLCEIFPKTANAFEQFGAACIYTSFFTVVGFHLPPALVWFPLICFLACIGLSVCCCLPIVKEVLCKP